MQSDLSEPLYRIPTYTQTTDSWGYSNFYTRQSFLDYLLPLLKEPGELEFDEISFEFNKQGRLFNKNKKYCEHREGSRNFKTYWDTEKEKCRKGVIFIGEHNHWYLARDYYQWLNFLPIFDKEAGNFNFPTVYDGQYYVALYETIAELSYKHIVMFKKRQFAMSYFHAAKLINQYWFEKGVTLKLLASLDTYIGEEGTWMYLNEYRDFLNEHTAWYRSSEPDKVKNWQQKIAVTTRGRKTNKGGKARLIGISTQQSATKGVGGPARYAIYEEAGIAPTMDKSYRYMKPALESGFITTGTFIAYGSVGDIQQCEPLKKFMLKPKENGFFSTKTNLLDNKGTIAETGLFIPEQWCMPPFIDQYGNSDVKGALKALLAKREEMKRDLTPEDYQLEVSQHPINIEEGFAHRTEAVFSPSHVSKQIQRIEDGEYPSQFIDLYEDEQKNIVSKLSKKIPITEFPVPKKMVNKEGVLVVYERPDPKAKWGTYSASIDPVAGGKTESSDSLCSIIVYKNPVHVRKHNEDGTISSHVEGDKVVATWAGRYDDEKKTNKQLEYIIRWYNAWTICEVNVNVFVNHMIAENLQHYLVPKDQVLFLKELSSSTGHYDYGWKNVGVMFVNNLLPYGKNALTEELSVETEPDGTIIRVHYGVERIPDIMLLKEMKVYRHGMNVDRIVTWCALMAFVKIQYANRGPITREEYTKKLENPQNNGRLKLNPYNHIGRTNSTNTDPRYKIKRSPYNHYR